MDALLVISDWVKEKKWDEFAAIGVDCLHYEDHQMVLLDYNQIEAKDNHPISDECRGLLVDYSGFIVRKGMTRFYNLGQAGHDTFDFENSIAFEKADGSLMFVAWCPATNRWEIGTRGTAFAEGPKEFYGTFRTFMLAAMGRTEAQFQSDMIGFNRWDTFLFEAVGPNNRIVTPYDTDHLVYLSSFNKKTGTENMTFYSFTDFEQLEWNVRPLRTYKFNSQADCLVALNELKNLEEGYVVRNSVTGERVKIKNAVYLAAHRLRGNGLTLNAVCELVVMREESEYLATFPEDAPKFVSAIEELHFMLHQMAANYDMFKAIESQKDFALSIKDLPLSGCMFSARKNGTEPAHEFNKLPTSKKADLLKAMLV